MFIENMFKCIFFIASVLVFAALPPDEGERLARSRCSTCHVFPEPGLLPKAMWRDHVLPHMGYFLGRFPNDSVRLSLLEKNVDVGKLEAVYPMEPNINGIDWEKITAFYLKNAPEKLEANTTESLLSLSLFQPRIPVEKFAIPSATMVAFRRDGGVMLGDANTQRLAWYDPNLKLEKAGRLGEGVVQCHDNGQALNILVMGQFSPTDKPLGQLIRLPHQGARAEVLLDSLQRPVNAAFADFNNDGLEDVAVCEFGRWTGALRVFFQKTDGTYTPHLLRATPGATRVYARDLNRDGLVDMMTLFAQGDEGIYQYINLGNGKFREETVLRFPPSWGSSSFRLFDVDADGMEDIVYTCGDNADYPPVLKPYHGIRIYLNKGKKGYQQSYFYPMHGAYDAIPADFDQDGDIDLAAVSFFPDWENQPRSGFVYLENTGNWKMRPRTFDGVENGRWMVMDAGDLEGDGDLDLVLGPLCMDTKPNHGQMERWLRAGVPFLILENLSAK